MIFLHHRALLGLKIVVAADYRTPRHRAGQNPIAVTVDRHPSHVILGLVPLLSGLFSFTLLVMVGEGRPSTFFC
jgi:hypothetical protein